MAENSWYEEITPLSPYVYAVMCVWRFMWQLFCAYVAHQCWGNYIFEDRWGEGQLSVKDYISVMHNQLLFCVPSCDCGSYVVQRCTLYCNAMHIACVTRQLHTVVGMCVCRWYRAVSISRLLILSSHLTWINYSSTRPQCVSPSVLFLIILYYGRPVE